MRGPIKDLLYGLAREGSRLRSLEDLPNDFRHGWVLLVGVLFYP